ncbi:MAG: DUF6449 domain-containing protein [Schaedlerella sp.]|nr:DUF6449 domain-containing protein [Schaedlerella sp.]
MTSRISLVKLIKEEFSHRMISIFATILAFLTEILFFYFDIQRLAEMDHELGFHAEAIASAASPDFDNMILTIGLSVLLAFEFFCYLHSQKKSDFYLSLPVKRVNQFWIGMVVCGMIYMVPCIIAQLAECMIGYATGYGTTTYLYNILWTLICKILVFSACFVTMALAMIMTGNYVIAIMGFGVFCIYVPVILKWIIPAFSEMFFDTYAGLKDFSAVWNYFSPVSLAYGLTMDYEMWTLERHTNYLIAIIIFIIVVSMTAQYLYVKRSAEAAGRAMAFTKANAAIRFLIVVPFALYCGYFLRMTAPNNAIGWLFAGTIVGGILMHGILESIFQFDLKGMLVKKKQMVFTVLICCLFIFIIKIDLLKYDEYVPDVEDVESVSIVFNTDTMYFYESYDAEKDGIHGEALKDVVLLADELVKENDQLLQMIRMNEDQMEEGVQTAWIQIQYELRNGSSKARQYYMDISNEKVKNLMDTIVATEEFKDDFFDLYHKKSEDIKTLTLDNVVSVQSLMLSDEEQKKFLEIYLQELTEQTFTQTEDEQILTKLKVEYKEQEYVGYYSNEVYNIYKGFKNTIAFLEKCGVELKDPLADSEVLSIEFYEEGKKPAFTVSDSELLDEVKHELQLVELYQDGYISNIKNTRFASIEAIVNGRHTVYDVYVYPETEEKLEKAVKQDLKLQGE